MENILTIGISTRALFDLEYENSIFVEQGAAAYVDYMVSHERVIRTFRSWGVRIDEAHFLGGMDKTAVLKAFGANIFCDDNDDNIKAASNIVLAVKVPNFLRVV